MNWRGVWSVSEQYYKNDVVSSPISNLSYVLDLTSLLGGSDPSSNADWVLIESGVRSITAGTGITLGGTSTVPVINAAAAGITSITAGTGITIDNTNPSVPIVTCIAPLLQQTVFLDNAAGTVPAQRLVWGTTYIVYFQTTGIPAQLRFIMPSSAITTTSAQQCVIKCLNGVTSSNGPLWVTNALGGTTSVSVGLLDNTLTTITIMPYISGATRQWRISYEGVTPYQQQITMANT